MVLLVQKEKGPESWKPSGPWFREVVGASYECTMSTRVRWRPEALASRQQHAQVNIMGTRARY
jgi:hypothetical protein